MADITGRAVGHNESALAVDVVSDIAVDVVADIASKSSVIKILCFATR